jgi:uncharacterized protein YqgV (UPF0045/DUF77 family)
MQVSVDLSLYPLADEYVPAIIDLIHRLQAREGIEVVRSALSTQLFGDYERVMQAVTEELRRSWEQHGRAVLVAKFVLGDVRAGG